MTRIAELYVNGALVGRDLAEGEATELDFGAQEWRITKGDLVRAVPLAQLAQIFFDGVELWSNPTAGVAKAIEQGRIHTIVASDGVKLVDQAG